MHAETIPKIFLQFAGFPFSIRGGLFCRLVQLAFTDGPDEFDDHVPSLGDKFLGSVIWNVKEHDAAMLPRLPKICEAGEVDEVAEVVARVPGDSELPAILTLSTVQR